MANDVIIRVVARDDTAGVREVIRNGFGVTGRQAGEEFTKGVGEGVKGTAPQSQEDGRKVGEGLGKGIGEGGKAPAKKSGEDVGDEAGKAAKAKASQAGKDTGSLLGAALLAGMPLAGTAAGAALVGGVGLGLVGLSAVVATQSDKVKAEVQRFGVDLKTAAQGWAPTVEGPVTDALHTVEVGFQQLRPQIGTALNNIAPDIRILGSAVSDLGTQAMPGLVRASGNLIPVFTGIQGAARSVGQAVGQAASDVSQHSAQIGTGISLIGQATASLVSTAVPLVNDLADTFAHGLGGQLVSTLHTAGSTIDGIAHTALPALGGGIQADLMVLNAFMGALGPASSLLGTFGGTALSAYMNVSLLSKLQQPIGSAVTALENAGTKGTAFGDVTTKISGGLKKVGDSLPYVGVGLALLGTALDLDAQHANDLNDASDKLAQSLEAGGARAVQARNQIDAGRKANDQYVQSMKDLEAAQTGGTQTADVYGNKAGQNATQIAELSGKVQDNKKVADDALKKYNDWAAQMGLTAITAMQLSGQVGILASSTASASSNSTQLKTDLDILNTAASTADQKIKALADSLAILGDHGMQKAHDFQAQFGTALDSFAQQMTSAKGKILDVNGALDLNSEKGRDVLSVLEQSQQSWAGEAQSMADAGQSTAQINAALDQNRQRLHDVLRAAGLTEDQVNSLISTYGLIPKNISTEVHANTQPAIDATVNLVRWINGQRAVVVVDQVTGSTVGVNYGGRVTGRNASAQGGVTSFSGAATGMALPGGLRVVGEQGAEVIRDAVGATVIPRSGVDKAITDAMSNSGGGRTPSGIQVMFAGNVDSAFATAFMNLCRSGQITILPQFIQK